MPILYNLFEKAIISLLFLSIFTSKAGMYISMSFLLILQIFELYNSKEIVSKISTQKITLISLFLFSLGALSSLNSPNFSYTFFLYFKKGAIFLLLPMLLIQIKKHCKHITTPLYIGLFIAMLYSFKKIIELNNGIWNGERIDSIWDVGRWGELLGYIISILTPLVFYRNKKNHSLFVHIPLLTGSILFLLLSGCRGPMLAILITLPLFLIIKRKKVFLITTLFITLIFVAWGSTSQIQSIKHRLHSISDFNHNASNSGRIEMWKKGVDFIYHNATNDPKKFLLGTGLSSFENDYNSYFKNHDNVEKIMKSSSYQFSFRDIHNTYLDLAAKLGILYVITYIFFLFMLFKHFFYLCKKCDSPWAFSGLCLMLTYIINSMFYTSGLEYQTIAFFSLLALCQAKHCAYVKQKEI